MNGTVSYFTVAVVVVVLAFIFGPPQSRVVFLFVLLAAAFIPVFLTLATGAVTGIEALDNILSGLRGGR